MNHAAIDGCIGVCAARKKRHKMFRIPRLQVLASESCQVVEIGASCTASKLDALLDDHQRHRHHDACRRVRDPKTC